MSAIPGNSGRLTGGGKRGADRSITDVIGSVEREPKPELVIVRQPQKNGQRFRYQKEERNPGVIFGEGTTDFRKEYMAVEVQGLPPNTEVFLIISCVTASKPYQPHPHQLQGDNCKDGIFSMKFTGRLELTKLGIKCTKKQDHGAALEKRREQKINPYDTSWTLDKNLDINQVRLCFQPFIRNKGGRFHHALNPVVSQIIHDKKSMGDLTIHRVSSDSGPAEGNSEILMFCSKVTKKDNIEVVFEDKSIDWIHRVPINDRDIHHQFALAFKPPPYPHRRTTPSDVMFYLHRPEDGETSEPMRFQYAAADPKRAASTKRLRKAPAGDFSEFNRPDVPLACDEVASEDISITSLKESLSELTEAVMDAQPSPIKGEASFHPATVHMSPTQEKSVLHQPLSAEAPVVPPVTGSSQQIAPDQSEMAQLNSAIATLQQKGFLVYGPQEKQGLIDASHIDVQNIQELEHPSPEHYLKNLDFEQLQGAHLLDLESQELDAVVETVHQQK